ncbi:unnamed protein product [Adineta steineri]|uniref:Uncharacterized protein n=1 Tax=Adineta steineri TaxID=433720 RepID=A0A813XHV9_9BILA|nr:unnamed protein product [Adineta steineri]CAF1419642.1 unnamed protein product [Adineta steineri]
MSQIHPQQIPYVTIQQPMPSADPFRTYKNEWHTGLCSCTDDWSQCCYAYFCWCCFMGSLADSIDESKWSCLCVPNALAVYRMKVRSILHIRGGACDDYCTTAFCSFCVGVQMRNELKHHGIN